MDRMGPTLDRAILRILPTLFPALRRCREGPRQRPLNRIGRMDGMRAGSGQGHPAYPAHPVPSLFAVAGKSRVKGFSTG